MLSSDANLGMWATDGGRTQVPGFLVHLVSQATCHPSLFQCISLISMTMHMLKPDERTGVRHAAIRMITILVRLAVTATGE
jgi:hypothetical protein